MRPSRAGGVVYARTNHSLEFAEGETFFVFLRFVESLKMIIAILGPKSGFTQFGIDVLLSTLEAMKGNAQFHTMIDLDVDALDAIARQSESAVVNCTLPSSELCRQLEMRGIPFVIFLDNGASLYRKLRTIDGLESYDAIRAASLYLATLHDEAVENPRTIFKREELFELGPEIFSLKLIDSLDVLAGDTTVNTLVKSMVARKAASNAIIDSDDSQLIAEEDDSLIVNVLDPFYSVKETTPLRKVTWPPSLFFCAENDPFKGPCSLIGPARIIIHGPYLHLPPGGWVATIDFEVADNLSGNIIISEIASSAVMNNEELSQKELARGEFGLPAYGRFTFEQAFEVASPLESLQIRFSTKEGAIEGSFGLRKVTVSRA